MSWEERVTARTIQLHDRECNCGDDISTMGKWRYEAIVEQLEKDGKALDFIEQVMSGTEWSPDTLDVIANVVVGTGRKIEGIE